MLRYQFGKDFLQAEDFCVELSERVLYDFLGVQRAGGLHGEDKLFF